MTPLAPAAKAALVSDAGRDSAGKQHRPAVGDGERARQELQRFSRSAEMTSRFTALGDQAVGVPGHRTAGLVLRAHHDEDENARRPESVDQLAVAAEGHHGDVDAGVDAHGNMAAAQEGGEQVDRDCAAGRTLPDPHDRSRSSSAGSEAECAQTASAGHCGGEFGTRQPPAHSGLADRNIEAQPVKQVHGPEGLAAWGW